MAPPGAPVDRRDVRLALLLALLAFLVYNANFRLIAAGDSYPARFIPFGLWGHGTVYLDPIREVTAQKYRQPYWIQLTHRGSYASLYPVVTPVLVAPLYAPAVLYLQVAGWSYENVSRVGAIMEKAAASLVASGAVFLMFLALRRRVDRRDALLLTAAFAFGTATWSVSSQALWQHGPAELMVAAALWLMTGAPTRGNALAAGLATGLLAANRPPDVLIAAAFSLYALAWARGRAALFALAAAVPVLLVLAYNLFTFANLGGGYGAIGVVSTEFFAHPLLPGMAGLLASPGRGLFLFCPFLLFLPLLFHRSLRDRENRLLTLLLTVAAVLQILLYARADWRGGYSFGPRFLTDLVPVLVWMLAPVLASLGRPARAVFLAGCLFAVWVQAVGAFQFSGASFAFQYTPPPGPEEMRNVWRWREPAFLMEARNPRQRADLLDTLQSLAHPVAPRPTVPVAPPVEYPRRSPATAQATPRVSPASDFYTVASCVLVDTRAGAPLRRGDAPRKLKLAGAGCAIPASAIALVGGVSVLEGSAPGSVLLFPEGTGRGALELSFGEGGPRDFAFILPLVPEAGGAVTVTTTSPGAHLLLYTKGYFANEPAAEGR
jgi:hypothetical protein